MYGHFHLVGTREGCHERTYSNFKLDVGCTVALARALECSLCVVVEPAVVPQTARRGRLMGVFCASVG